jgi:hypothetical protein
MVYANVNTTSSIFQTIYFKSTFKFESKRNQNVQHVSNARNVFYVFIRSLMAGYMKAADT